MRQLLVVCFAVAFAGCDVGGRSEARASLLSEAGGEVALADGSSFGFRITSEKYKQWDAAQRGISKRIAARFGEILNPDAPTERSIDRAVAYLESQTGARQAIDAAGLSVREFVVMTVALEQEMRLASSEGERPPGPSQPYDFPPIDTTFIAPQPVAPVPTPTDTAIPVDTTFVLPRPRVDTTIARPPAPPPTVFRRDTAVARRDSIVPRRDTARTPGAPPVTRDTVRDTLPSAGPIPPDSLPRT